MAGEEGRASQPLANGLQAKRLQLERLTPEHGGLPGGEGCWELTQARQPAEEEPWP